MTRQTWGLAGGQGVALDGDAAMAKGTDVGQPLTAGSQGIYTGPVAPAERQAAVSATNRGLTIVAITGVKTLMVRMRVSVLVRGGRCKGLSFVKARTSVGGVREGQGERFW